MLWAQLVFNLGNILDQAKWIAFVSVGPEARLVLTYMLSHRSNCSEEFSLQISINQNESIQRP